MPFGEPEVFGCSEALGLASADKMSGSMDVSSHHLGATDLIRITVDPGPLSPWIRLAVSVTVREEYAVDTAQLRTIDDFEIILQTEGHTWTWLEPYGTVEVAPGDVIFNPPHLPHGWAYNAGKHLAIHFDFHANPDLVPMRNLHPTDRLVRRQPLPAVPTFLLKFGETEPETGAILPFVTPARNVSAWKERMSHVIEVWQRDARPTLAFQLLAAETVGWMLRTLAEDAAHQGLAQRTEPDTRILALLKELDAVADSAAQPWLSVSEMARRTGLGPTAFHAHFQRLTGRSPRRYLEERRIARAEQVLINTNRAIGEIARMEGYEDAYHFSRVFKRVTGFSPSLYRERALGK